MFILISLKELIECEKLRGKPTILGKILNKILMIFRKVLRPTLFITKIKKTSSPLFITERKKTSSPLE